MKKWQKSKRMIHVEKKGEIQMTRPEKAEKKTGKMEKVRIK